MNVRVIECSIQITWSRPANGGAPITRYQIEVCPANRRGICNDLSSLCGRDVNINTCTVPMTSLQSLGVAPGEQIRVRAKAYNSNGWSPASAFNTGVALMRGSAPKMPIPSISKTGSAISIRWTPIN